MILRINDRFRNRQIKFFTDFEFDLKFDSIDSSFSLSYEFDPNNQEHIEFSCIGHYHTCTLEDNGELLMTGIILSIQFTDAAKQSLAKISGYTLSGVLGDCEIPLSKQLSLQSDGLTIREIVQKYIKPFGLQIVVESSAAKLMDQVLEETSANETQTVKSYLSQLVSQKNVIMSHDERGRVVFTKTSARAKQKPIFEFNQGMPGVSMTLAFNGQGIHSEIVAIGQSDIEDENALESPPLKNPFSPVRTVFRPHTVTQNSGNADDTELAAKNTLAAELKNIPLMIAMDRWTIGEKLARPGNIITVQNPRIYLFKKSNWFIEAVNFKGDAKSKTATLRCVRPEVFNGETPEYLWKGINLH
jgi:prophage tail gpP-like protein